MPNPDREADAFDDGDLGPTAEEIIDSLRDDLDYAYKEIDALRQQLEAARKDAFDAAVLGMAAVATYGNRDENGLCGLSKKHYRELGKIYSRCAPKGAARTAKDST